ncbi:hypothetical protein L596_002963 [Steinernema carpocapsae]|uniref:F-box domain-containing protein n=1 Tax=Steinernema carpocapsae TaxID=34508 RepID=A0A4U8URN7_STECR|nr:hypothetical protein L596_002963 [Steinernema carpocapsae]
MLPNNLLLKVFDNLGDDTLFECRKVNRQFKEAADKTLRDKKRFAVQIHVEKDKDVVFRNFYTKLREIPSATIQAHLKDIQEGKKDPVEYLPRFITVGELHLDARFLSCARIGETVKILKTEGIQALSKVSLTWHKQQLNMFSLMKLIERAPLKALDLNWYDGGRVTSNAKYFATCLAFLKNVGSKLSYSLFVRGPFSVAEMIDVMCKNAVHCPKASFLLNKTRINAGDGSIAIRHFIESLRDNKRFCKVEIKSMHGSLSLPIGDATRGFNGSFTFTRNGEEKIGNVEFDYEHTGFEYSKAIIRSYEV